MKDEFSFQEVNLFGLLGIKSIYNPFFSLSPNLIEVVKKKLEFGLSKLASSFFDKFFAIAINLLRDPKATLWNKFFIASTEMKG